MKKLLVIGSANQDVTLRLTTFPLPGQCLIADGVSTQLGGKGLNQAVAAARQGADVTFAGRIGCDGTGNAMVALLEREGVHNAVTHDPQAPTGSAYILLERNSENRIIVHGGANQTFSPEAVEAMEALVDSHDLLLLQLEISMWAIERVLQRAAQGRKTVVLDGGPARPGLLPMMRGIFCVSPNETELAVLTQMPCRTHEERIAACRRILEHGVHAVLLKLGSNGSLWVTADGESAFPACQGVHAVDTTGAGDAFTAAFACALLRGETEREAIRYATRAGAAAVTKHGAIDAMPSRQEILSMPDPLR